MSDKKLAFMIGIAGKTDAQASAEMMAALGKFRLAEESAKVPAGTGGKAEAPDKDQLTPEERAALDAYLNRPQAEKDASAKRFHEFVVGVVGELHKNPEESNRD